MKQQSKREYYLGHSPQKAIYSAQYILEELKSEKGMQELSRITGLPMGVIVDAMNNIFKKEILHGRKKSNFS